ncbi:hypothetical protein YC2023_040129 [Brassica napus]
MIHRNNRHSLASQPLRRKRFQPRVPNSGEIQSGTKLQRRKAKNAFTPRKLKPAKAELTKPPLAVTPATSPPQGLITPRVDTSGWKLDRTPTKRTERGDEEEVGERF